jgi:HK97 gp10 family phage protein
VIKFDASALRAAISSTTSAIAESVGEGALRAAGFAGAEVFRDEAKENSLKNKKTGVLHDNIIVKRLEEESSDTKQAYIVTVRTGKFGTEGDAFYWRFVEFGHSFVRRSKGKRDTITKRRAEALEFGTSSAPAYPFMRPAYESKKAEAVEAMQAKLAEKIKQGRG